MADICRGLMAGMSAEGSKSLMAASIEFEIGNKLAKGELGMLNLPGDLRPLAD